MKERLFDPAHVPADVVSPSGVAEVNAVVERLRAYLVDLVELQEPVSRFRVSNMTRVYSQSHLRRSLQLIEAANRLVYAGQGLAALMLVRSLYETVANYVAISNQLVELIEAEAPLQEIHDFIRGRTFATRSERLIKIAGSDEVKPTNILTQVKKIESAARRLRAGIRISLRAYTPECLRRDTLLYRSKASGRRSCFHRARPRSEGRFEMGLSGGSHSGALCRRNGQARRPSPGPQRAWQA